MYFVKLKQGLKKSPKKSKSKKIDCEVKSGSPNDEIIYCKIENKNSLSIVKGSIFSLERQNINLIGEDGKVKTLIILNNQ